jgi:hypothetical protein
MASILPNFVTPLGKGLRVPELLQADQVSDVARQLAEDKDLLDLLHCGWLQSIELVPHDGGPVVVATRVVQPFARPLGGAETVGAKQDVLQLLVRVGVGSEDFAQQADTVGQREREL